MNNNLLKLALCATVGVTVCANAQQLEERKALVEPAGVTQLEQLRDRFQQEFEAKEARIRAWLLDNPTRQRTEMIDGRAQTIVRIDEGGNPVYQVTRDGEEVSRGTFKNLASGQLIKADSLYPGGSIGASITGTGMVAGVWEPSAVRATHELLAGQATNQAGQVDSTDAGARDHAAHVTGTMVGKDLASHPSARGIAYGGTSKNWDATNDLAEMTQFATDGFLVSNHSYGDANKQTTDLWKYGAYDAEAKNWDALTKAAPYYLPFIAIGNEQGTAGTDPQSRSGNFGKLGYDIVTGSAASKNVMVVGAVNADKTMSDYSNWGPTDDGRVKPEIVAKGTGIDSAQATSDTAYSGNGVGSSGTSYASPAAAAAGLLLQQYYKSLHGSYMLSSTLKALMLGTAEDLGNPGPDHQFGWGLLNVENAAKAIKQRSFNLAPTATQGSYTTPNQHGAIIDELTANPVASPTAEMSRRFNAKGGVPLVVNLAWTDDDGPEQTATDGVDPTTSRAVYDFDFMVRDSSTGSDVRTWVVPSMANRTQNATVSTGWFASSGSNFKQVIIPSPVAGRQYILYMRKSAGSPVANRTLSLVVTGLVESPVYTVTPSAGANGTLACIATAVNGGTSTSCTATPGAGYRTTSISGCNGTATVAGVNLYTTGAVNANCTVTSAFEQLTYVITGTASPSAGGTVSCTPNPVNYGGTATCTATPAAGYTFTAFSGDCTGSTCSLPNVTSAKSATAAFTLNTYAVTGTASPTAGGTVSCTPNPVNYGGTATCTATPAAGYTFTAFSGDCAGSTCSLPNVTSAKSATAAFTLNTYAVTGTASPTAGGTVSCTPNPVNYGGAATCTATPAAGYTFTAFSGDCTGSTCSLPNVTSAKSATAAFTLNTYAVTGTASPTAGGTVSCTPNPVNYGGTAMCTATPAAGYTFTAFSGDCTGSTCSLPNVTSAKSATAAFTLNTYAVTGTASPTAGGTVSCTPNPVNYGGTAMCTATPAAGYTFTAFSGDCTGATCSLTSVISAKSVVGTFSANATTTTTTSGNAPGGGAVTATFTGGSAGCSYQTTAFKSASAVPATLPTGVSFPQGVFEFTTNAQCGGNTLSFTINYAQALPAGARYYKFGPEPGNTTPHWYVLTSAVITTTGGTSQVTFSITDNGVGDSDPTVGVIADPGGPGVLADPVVGSAAPVPTLGEWGLMLLIGLMGLLGMRSSRVGLGLKVQRH